MENFIDFEMAKKLKEREEEEAETGAFQRAYERFLMECGESFTDAEAEGKELVVNWTDTYGGDADDQKS